MEVLVATSPSWAITVVRVILGVIFFAHGSQKVFGWFGGYGLNSTGLLGSEHTGRSCRMPGEPFRSTSISRNTRTRSTIR